jgi:hypothetical protein
MQREKQQQHLRLVLKVEQSVLSLMLNTLLQKALLLQQNSRSSITGASKLFDMRATYDLVLQLTGQKTKITI